MGKDVMSILDMVQADLGGDPKRTYVTGQSMGGNGAWKIAAQYRGRFAAVAPVCGYLQQGTGRRKKVVQGLLDTPVWAFHAQNDKVVNVTHSDDMVRMLQRRGNERVKYTRYERAPSSNGLNGHASY